MYHAPELWLMAEVQHETHLEIGLMWTVQELSFRDRGQTLRRLELHDHAIVNDHIESLVGDQFTELVDGNQDLASDPMSTCR